MHPYINSKKNLMILKKRVKNRCNLKFKSKDPEDLFQDVCLHLIERPNCSSTLDQIIIDVLRKETGRSDSSLYSVRIAMKNAYRIETLELKWPSGKLMTPEESIRSLLQDDEYMSYRPCDQVDWSHDLEKAWPNMSKKEKEVIHDLFFLEKTLLEVAKKRKVSEQMISVYKYDAFDRMREALE